MVMVAPLRVMVAPIRIMVAPLRVMVTPLRVMIAGNGSTSTTRAYSLKLAT